MLLSRPRTPLSLGKLGYYGPECALLIDYETQADFLPDYLVYRRADRDVDQQRSEDQASNHRNASARPDADRSRSTKPVTR